jgi:hypothetical protein
VVGHDDARGNVYPRKARPEQKIDAVIALIMALERAISGQINEPDMGDFLANPNFLWGTSLTPYPSGGYRLP